MIILNGDYKQIEWYKMRQKQYQNKETQTNLRYKLQNPHIKNNNQSHHFPAFLQNILMISPTAQQHQPTVLSPSQVFQKIVIASPLSQTQYTNITYKSAQQKLMSQLEQLVKSSFYTHFDVYLGVRSLSNRSYLQEMYKREEEILKLKIEETKKSIFQLSRSTDQHEFDNARKRFNGSMKIIQQRAQDVDHVDFVPVIYVDAQRKRPFYGHLMQQFNRKGAGMLNIKVGYRAPFTKLDCLQFKFQSPLTNLKRKYYNINLQWKNPLKENNIFARLGHGNEETFKEIDEKSNSFVVGVENIKHNYRVEWENKLRNPSIHANYDNHVMKGYHLPSFKSSLKLTKVWHNSIEFNDINMGSYLETKAQTTIPGLSKAHFIKAQVNWRKFYDPIAVKNSLDNWLAKKLFGGSSLETNASFNLMAPIYKKYVSDVTENLQVRGFDQPRVPVPTFSNLKLSAKFNIHNYPVIGSARITPFLYVQSGLSLLDMTQERNRPQPHNPTQLYTMGSLGMGLAYYVNTFAQIQVIYNLLGYQNLKRRQPTGFQVRIGVFD